MVFYKTWSPSTKAMYEKTLGKTCVGFPAFFPQKLYDYSYSKIKHGEKIKEQYPVLITLLYGGQDLGECMLTALFSGSDVYC